MDPPCQGSGRPASQSSRHRAHCNRGRPPRRGDRVHCQQLDHPRLVPGPSVSMMATGRMRPAAIALIFLLDPPENGQRRDMSAALSGRGRPMPYPFCPSPADTPGQANCRSIAGSRLTSPPAPRTPAARIRTWSTIEAVADRRRGAITLQQVPLGRAGTAPGNPRSAGHPHVRLVRAAAGSAHSFDREALYSSVS